MQERGKRVHRKDKAIKMTGNTKLQRGKNKGEGKTAGFDLFFGALASQKSLWKSAILKKQKMPDLYINVSYENLNISFQ